MGTWIFQMWEGYTVQTNLLLIHHQVKTRLLVPFLFPNFSEQQNHGSVPKSIRGSSLGFRVGTRTFHLAGGGEESYEWTKTCSKPSRLRWTFLKNREGEREGSQLISGRQKLNEFDRFSLSIVVERLLSSLTPFPIHDS